MSFKYKIYSEIKADTLIALTKTNNKTIRSTFVYDPDQPVLSDHMASPMWRYIHVKTKAED